MSKIVKTVIVVAIAVAVVVFAPQIAAVLASVAGSLGVTVAATAISSALIGMGISMALTAAATLFRKAPSMSQSMVDRLNTSVVPTASRKIIFGTTAGGADVRFFEGDLDLPSTKKDGYVQVVALASHRINALKQFYVENELVWQNGSFVSKRNGFAPNNPFRVVIDGKPDNGFLVGSGRYWNSASTFTGCAYFVPFWKLDTDVWESGIPQRLTAIVEGCPLYDPRRDSTRGGSGAHRVNDQTTYAFRDGGVEIGRNPALALLTYLLGWRINGKVVWGMGIPANRIDFDNFRTYANLCEEGVSTQSGTTVQRYTADGIFSTTDSHETVINGLTAAMGSCKLTDRGGTYCIVGGYDDTAGPKVAFDADDLVAPANGSSPYIWNPAPASRERFNIVRGRFANPEELYQLTDWGDPIEREPLADGIPRTMSIDLFAVSRAETCQRIAKQMLLREYLCPGMFAATFGPKAFAVEIGSVITLSLPAEGWNNKLFRVMEQAESHDLFFQMTLREEDPAIYAWDREEKPLPAIIRPQGYDPSTTIAPSNLAVTSASYSGANGVNVSEVHVKWTSELSGRVNGIQIQSRPAGTNAWSEQAALFDPKIGSFTFTSNAPGITVEVRARFRMMSAIYSPWVNVSVATAKVITITDWENVTNTSGTRPADNADVTGNNTSKDTLAVGGVPAAELIGRINAIIRDNVISREEKPGLLRDYNSLTGTSGEINILAERARVRGLDSGAMGSAKYNLDVALNALSSPTAWNDLSGNTNFNTTTTREIFQQRWLEMDRAIIAMRAALDADAKAAETEAFKRVEQAASDGWLTPKEKLDAEVDYNNMVDRLSELVTRCGVMGDPANVLTARNEAGNAIYRGYGTSYLGDYLYPIISNRTGNTAIDPAVFVARWRDATRKLALFESLLIGSVNLDTQAAITAINDLDSDGIWTTIEKSKVLIPEINRLNNEYAVLVGKAQSIPNTAVGYSNLVGPLNTVISARKNWEDNRPAAWNNTSVDTIINRPYMRALIEGYGNALQALGDALRTYLDVKAQTALDRLGSIVSDGIINGFEKWKLVQDWQVINKRYNALNIRYAALGYPSDVTPSFNTAVQQLDLLGKYLGDLRPAWNDSNADTPVNMTDFNGYWVGALSAMDSYHATITGRPGPKGDTGATGSGGGGTTTRSPSTLTFSTGVQTAGWHSPTIVVNMTPGMSIPVEMYMSGYSGYSSASNVAIYIQAFRSSDGSLLTNFGPTSIYAPATTPSGQPINDSPGSGYVRGTFTNNTGVTQNIGFWAHVSSGNIQNDGNSYLRV